MLSLLIDSILRGIPINTIYTIQDTVTVDGVSKAVYSIIDGIQRTTTIHKFVLDKFTLATNLKPVDGEEIAGKTFSQLSKKLQDRIWNTEIDNYNITAYTEEEVRELYKRQNNGKALNKRQLRPVIENDAVLDVVFRISSHELFIGAKETTASEADQEVKKEEPEVKKEETTEESKEPEKKKGKGRPKKQEVWQGLMSASQIKGAVDRDIIIETLMLMFEGEGTYNLAFTSKDIDNFIQYYLNDNIVEKAKQIKVLEEAISKLYLAVKDNTNIKINTSSLPMVLYGAYKTLSSKKSFSKYCENVMKFIAGYNENEAYKVFCEKHTTSKENVLGRLNYFKTKVIPS